MPANGPTLEMKTRTGYRSLRMRRDDPSYVLEPAVAVPRRPWPEKWTTERVIEALEPLVVDERRARLAAVIGQRLGSVTVLMDAPHDPHNGGAVMRSADAFGVQEVHVIPRIESFQAANSVARGAERWVDVIEHAAPTAAVAALTRAGFELVATDPDGQLVPRDLREIPRLCLVLGNEKDGICAELVAAARRTVRIPMRGFVESLNVSVSAAILLHAATEGRAGDLTMAHQRELYAQGLYRTVTHAGRILACLEPATASGPA